MTDEHYQEEDSGVKVRNVWARGINPANYGSALELDTPATISRGMIRNVEHFDRGTVVTLLVEIDIPHRMPVKIVDP